jgi:hypothetical protein
MPVALTPLQQCTLSAPSPVRTSLSAKRGLLCFPCVWPSLSLCSMHNSRPSSATADSFPFCWSHAPSNHACSLAHMPSTSRVPLSCVSLPPLFPCSACPCRVLSFHVALLVVFSAPMSTHQLSQVVWHGQGNLGPAPQTLAAFAPTQSPPLPRA